jgi:hypothetical protein
MIKRSLGQKFLFVIFGTFGRYVTNLRGTFVENVKKVQNQPTLLCNRHYSFCYIVLNSHLFNLQVPSTHYTIFPDGTPTKAGATKPGATKPGATKPGATRPGRKATEPGK